MKQLLLAICAACFAVQGNVAKAQGTVPAYRLVVTYDRPGLQVPHWQITIPARGLAQYTGKPEKGNDPGQILFPLSDAGRQKLSTLLNRSKGLQPCETKSKGLANMGLKDVVYAPAEGPEVHCAFNYTDNKPLGETLDYMLALAGTLQAGMEIDRLHRYDRLGLDPVMIRLAEDAKSGHAVEIGAIRPTLESLVADEALLDRVRSRAQQLLDLARLQDAAKP
ncbi:MAG: hypothetical protein ACRYGF_08690 [Janthinobacterium lividum]